MSKFKVGDRVRIVSTDSDARGREATVWKIDPNSEWDEIRLRGTVAYCVDVDGWGRHSRSGKEIAFPEYELAPLVPPDELAWQKFREHLKPNPLVIFDADPITVSTEHEAEAIADRVPNSHIIVAVYRNGKRIVLSEYYGESQSNRP